jgi:hypothetical protein
MIRKHRRFSFVNGKTFRNTVQLTFRAFSETGMSLSGMAQWRRLTSVWKGLRFWDHFQQMWICKVGEKFISTRSLLIYIFYTIVAELRHKPGHNDLLRRGSLFDIYEAGTNKAKSRILNGLDFPMGHASTPPPPSYR